MDLTAHLEEILSCWGIHTIANWQAIQDNIAKITLDDGRSFVLKALGPCTAATIRRLHFEHEVLHHVEQQGLAVAVPLLSNHGVPYVCDADRIYRLSHWLSNQPAEAQTSAERARLYQNYGAAIGRFHQALANYVDDDILNKTWQTDLQTRVLDEAVPVILAHLEQDRLPVFQALLAEIEPEMRAAFADLPRQLIIWDCHCGNVAVDGFEVSGFIDCDHMSIAPRIFDLADFLVHLVKWDVGNVQKEALWLAHFPHFIRSYESITPLSTQERKALPYAMAGISLVFTDFFFQHGLPELTKVELATFDWLVRHRRAIIAHIEKQ